MAVLTSLSVEDVNITVTSLNIEDVKKNTASSDMQKPVVLESGEQPYCCQTSLVCSQCKTVMTGCH